nr:conjugative coupling factor TraD, SXT/TOL subfamily [Klebsiella pneumoniae]
MYLPLKDWQKQHADIIGTTGAGKGVAAGILLYQSILAGEGVFVMDPKDDEWAPHLYRKACEDAGKPFALIDLRKQQYQLNLIEDITPDELEELLVAGFSPAEKGQESDFIGSKTGKPRVWPHNLSAMIHRQQSGMFITVITCRVLPKNQSVLWED